LVELNNLGLDAGRKTALPAVKLENSIDVCSDRRAGEDLARREFDLGRDLVFLEPLITLKDDAVDDRVLANVDHEIAGFAAGNCDVRKELGRVEVLEGLVQSLGSIGLARRQICVRANGL